MDSGLKLCFVEINIKKDGIKILLQITRETRLGQEQIVKDMDLHDKLKDDVGYVKN